VKTIERPMSLPPFWILVEDHGGELLRHARRLVGDLDAEDVLQEALLRALRSYPRLEHGDHLRAWLFRITTTTAYDHSARKRGEVLVDDVPERHQEPDFYDDGFETLIDVLTPSAREALRLRYVDDLSYDEMATLLGCSQQAARQRVSTGVRELRRRFA
jgi:RNA polymerase sigma-70 factor (ECF subfamily)